MKRLNKESLFLTDVCFYAGRFQMGLFTSLKRDVKPWAYDKVLHYAYF